jgi:ABC-type phosphate transport system substrate-binding protein
MISRSARRLVLACILSAATVAALVAPGAASAAFVIEHCKGVPIEGRGATFQKLAQSEVWNPGFNVSKIACPGGPTVKYNSVGSGPGLESWGVETRTGVSTRFGPLNNYIASDNAPNAAQTKEIETHGKGGKVLTIPVLQGADTVSMRLPENCEATSTTAPGRLVLSDTLVEKIFRRVATKWTSIIGGGDKLVTTKAAKEKGLKCNPKTEITRVVRLEGSGTTAIFQKFLSVVYGKPVDEGKTWAQLGQLAANTKWPQETEKLIRGKGNPGVAAEIAAHAGSIGYVNLADARNNGNFSPPIGGAFKATFWAPVQNASKPTTTYADPSTDGDTSATPTRANCEETVYTNGKKPFPPKSTEEPWNEVTTSKVQKNYDICGVTFDLSLTKFEGYEGTEEGAATEAGTRTAFDYLSFVTNSEPEGGQTLLEENHDYLSLPTNESAEKNVRLIAQKGVEKISFK